MLRMLERTSASRASSRQRKLPRADMESAPTLQGSVSSTTWEPCGCRKAPRAVANIRPYRLQKSVFPLGRLKAGQDKIVAHQQRALDEHTVRRQQCELLVLGHGWQLVLQAQIFVD